jgi:AcrR family transcriptional regulator
MGSDESAAKVLDATLTCIARWGIAKTTLDDIARESGISRATIYRTFAGGKGALLHALLIRESLRFAAAVDAAAAPAETLEDLVVAGVTTTSSYLAGHDAFQFLLAHEPDTVLPEFAFHKLEGVLRQAAAIAAPHLARFLPADDVPRAAEWVTRVVLSYLLNPSEDLDLTDEVATRRFVRLYVLPSLAPTPISNTRS